MIPARRLRTLLALTLLPALAACGDQPGASGGKAHEPPAPITNRIDVPPAVRRNLGIDFATVRPRNVEDTRRVPGHFELRPEAHRAYPAPLSGQVTLKVKQYQAVTAGDVLYTLSSPAWRQMQKSLSDTVLAIRKARAGMDALAGRLEAVAGHRKHLQEELLIWEERVKQLDRLDAAGGGVATARTAARSSLARTRTSLAEVKEEAAELTARQALLRAELEGHAAATPLLHAEALGTPVVNPDEMPQDLALAGAAAVLGVTVAHLQENVATSGPARPRWRVLDRIEIRAGQDGLVETLAVTHGAWVGAGDAVLETADPRLLRFRAQGLQSDLAGLAPGLPARVLPPGGVASDDGLEGVLALGLEADPRRRKIDLLLTPKPAKLPHWARPGVSTDLEIVLAGTGAPQLAIPVACVIQDGLEKVFFRRDPKDKDKVIRVEADLGLSDGKWVVVESGLMEGDEVVRHGVYELMLASGGQKLEGGHFHADGTWHAEDH